MAGNRAALAIAVAIPLVACADADPRQPIVRCIERGPDLTYPSRVGVVRVQADCDREEVGCMAPLKLTHDADGNLICKLENGN